MFIYNSLEIPVKKSWVLKILEEYKSFLIGYHKEQKPVLHHLRSSKDIFLAMENILPNELTYEWLESNFDNNEKKRCKKSLTGFLIGKNLIQAPSNEAASRKSCENYIARLPKGFQKCVKLYMDDKFALMAHQIAKKSSKPIKPKTIEADILSIYKMVTWITEKNTAVVSWTDITETMVNQYLLSLSLQNREVNRKDLYCFFKFAKQKRFIFSIPMVDYKSREVPRKCEPLTRHEQRVLYQKLKDEGISYPYEALLTSLCFFHAMKSSHIREIPLAAVDLENSTIHMKEIPDIYLTPLEMVLLVEYLNQRKSFPNAEYNTHLFVKRNRGDYIPNNTIGKELLARMVKQFCGYTPQLLRITCLQEMSVLNGPQFLREAYGISVTHSSRYGSYEDYLIDETLENMELGYKSVEFSD